MIKYIVAICDEYDELAIDYNNLDAKYNKFAANCDNQLALKNQKKAVILYLKDHNRGLTAENETLCNLQNQGVIADLSIVNLFIVNLFVSHAGNKQHKPSLRLSVTISATAKPCCLKLQDLFELINKKSDVFVEHWLAKIESKMTADQDLINTSRKRIVYVINYVGGKAFSHLKPRA